MMRTARYLVLAAGCALVAVPATTRDACAQASQRGSQQPGTTVAYTTEVAATVESINRQTREVVLRGAGGRLFNVEAGPAVENLDRVQPGDRVVVRYIEALAASLAKPGEGGGGTVTERGGIARHAPEGSRPTGTLGSQMQATVMIEAVDHANHTVTFTGPANAARTVMVRDPDAQRFLDTLKPGDRVDLVYTESVAVAVEPLAR
ncbi:MAG TPA: hypothetical protein VNR89_19860 [Roseomonas sp.]|nr:hypothetical protein [Roseomonas sp.]